MDIRAFLEEFRLEAAEHLALLDACLLRLEREGVQAEVLRQMFLSAHTIKGGASMLSLGAIKVLTHALEDLLSGLRDARHPLDPPTVALLFEALDALRALVNEDPQRAGLSGTLEALEVRLREWPRGLAVSSGPGVPESAPAPPQALLLQPSATARAVLCAQLEAQGWQVDAEETLEGACGRIKTGGYALVVCAHEPLPGGVQPQALQALLPPGTPLLLVGLEPQEPPPGALWVPLLPGDGAGSVWPPAG